MSDDNGTAPPIFLLPLFHKEEDERVSSSITPFLPFTHLAADSDLIPNQSRNANYPGADSSLGFPIISAHVPALSYFLDLSC